MMLSKEHIEGVVRSESYIHIPNTTTTVCCLVVQNGFVVIGHSACIDPADFDAEMGRKIARDKAIDQLWQLEGYLAKQRMYEGSASDS